MSLNLILPKGLPVIQNLQNLIIVFLLIIVILGKVYSNRTVNITFFKIYALSLTNTTETFLKTKETDAEENMCLRKFLIFFYKNLVATIIFKILNCSCSLRCLVSKKVSTLDKKSPIWIKFSTSIKVSALY